MSVKAHEIKYALQKKHEDDLFLTEVKNGSTWLNRELAIMDAFAMKKSWTKPCFTGYEIKVSRSDFLNDDKWPVYKDLTHRFYFVCPKGLIKPDELPDDVGLIWYNPEKKNLYTRKKALFRDIEISADLLYYILMSRVDSSEHPFFSDKEEYFKEWLEHKINTRYLGVHVSAELINRLAEKENEVEKLKWRLKSMQEYEDIVHKIGEVLKKHNMNHWHLRGYHETIDEALSTSVPPQLVKEIETIKKISENLYESFKRPRERKDER